MAGNQDLFNAMKKLEKQKRKADKKREEEAASGGKTSSTASPNVFDFINSKLAGKKGKGLLHDFHFSFTQLLKGSMLLETIDLTHSTLRL